MSPARYLGAAVCLVLAGLSAYWAWAELIAIGPRSFLDVAAKTKAPLQDTNWDPAYKLLTGSLAIKPGDASLQYAAGRLAWRQGLHVMDKPDQRQRWLVTAQEHLQRALASRPTSGEAWAELANIYLQQRDYPGARLALNKAMALEPYEGSIQEMVFWTGFTLWPTLSEQERGVFLHIVQAALVNKSYYWVIDPAVQYHHENVIADLVAGDAAAVRHMQSRIRDREKQKRGH